MEWQPNNEGLVQVIALISASRTPDPTTQARVHEVCLRQLIEWAFTEYLFSNCKLATKFLTLTATLFTYFLG